MHNTSTVRDQAQHLREMRLANAYKPAHQLYTVTITSGKGGVGKSIIAVNVAIGLADLGKRVLLLDADPNLAKVDLLFGIIPEHRLGNVLRNEVSLEAALMSPYKNLSLLAGSSGEMDYPLHTNEQQEAFLNRLRHLSQPFDVLIIDTSAGLNQSIVHYACQSDETIVISTPEPTAIMDAYAMIKIINASKMNHPIRILINTAYQAIDADKAALNLKMAVHHFLQRDIGYLGSIPYDESVLRSVAEQIPLVQRYPRSSSALTLRALARTLLSTSLHASLTKAVNNE